RRVRHRPAGTAPGRPGSARRGARAAAAAASPATAGAAPAGSARRRQVPVIPLAGIAGGLIVAGLVLLVLELTRRPPAPGTPARQVGRATRRRALMAAGTGLVVLAVPRWPVAGIAAVAAVLFLPRMTSARAARRRVAVLEGLEQWTRRLADMLTASRGLEDAL